ncbi:transposase [Spirochaetia bacterium]|nr:transposase [Spirochaetia bacterium]
MSKIKFSYDDDIINPCRDNVFKSVFTRDTGPSRGALRWMLSAYIGQPVELLTVTANEPPPHSLRDRQIRFDIAVKFNNGQLGNVEMTTNPGIYEALRLEFHVCKLFTTQEIKGLDKSYKDLQSTYQISLLDKPLFKNDEALVHRFEYYDKEHNLPLGGKTTIITVELSKAEQIASRPAEEMSSAERWSVFFRYVTESKRRDLVNEIVACEEGIEMASEVLLTVSRDEVERAILDHEYKNALDMQSLLVDAKREGRTEGKAEGLQEGRTESLEQAARSLKTQGVSPEIISNSTGFTVDQIKNL